MCHECHGGGTYTPSVISRHFLMIESVDESGMAGWSVRARRSPGAREPGQVPAPDDGREVGRLCAHAPDPRVQVEGGRRRANYHPCALLAHATQATNGARRSATTPGGACRGASQYYANKVNRTGRHDPPPQYEEVVAGEMRWSPVRESTPLVLESFLRKRR